MQIFGRHVSGRICRVPNPKSSTHAFYPQVHYKAGLAKGVQHAWSIVGLLLVRMSSISCLAQSSFMIGMTRELTTDLPSFQLSLGSICNRPCICLLHATSVIEHNNTGTRLKVNKYNLLVDMHDSN